MIRGWETKALGELCEFQRGLTYSKSDEVDVSSNVVLRANNVDLTTHSLDLSELRYIADSISIPAAKKVRKGSLLICTASGSKSHLGKIAYVDEDYGYAFGGFMGQLTPAPIVDGRYLFHVLTSPTYKAFIEALSDGVNINNLKFDDLRNFLVPLPPRDEQQRIVAILDETFEAIATAKANAEKNLQNARELFESHLQSVLTRQTKGWIETTLREVTGGVFTGPFGSLLHKSDYVEGGIPLVNPAHITNTGIEPDLSKSVSKETAQRLDNYVMREGDIVIGRRGEMGRCAVVTHAEDGWLCGTGSFFIKPSARCEPRFLVRFLRSAETRANLERLAGGAVMPNLSNTALAGLAIRLPPVVRQREIIDGLDALAAETDRLTGICEQKQATLEALKASLLHQAFTGQL